MFFEPKKDDALNANPDGVGAVSAAIMRLRHRSALAMLLYPAGWFVISFFHAEPQPFLIVRGALGLVSGLVFLLTYLTVAHKALPLVFRVLLFAMTADSIFLLKQSNLDPIYVTVTFAVVLAVCSLITSRLSLAIYFIFTMSMTFGAVYLVDRNNPALLLPCWFAATFWVTYVALMNRIEGEKAFKELFQSTFRGVAVKEEGHTILDITADTALIFGFTRDEMIGRSLLDFIFSSNHPIVKARIGIVDEKPYEVVGMKKDGRPIGLELTGRHCLAAEGRLYLITARDITARKENEVENRVNERMASMNRLALGVGHEINNPLFVILGSLDLCLQRLNAATATPGTSADLLALLTTAKQSAERVRNAVHNLRFMYGTSAGTTGNVDINHVLEAAVGSLSNEIRPRAKLVKNLTAVPATQGSEAELGQVFVHLVQNAAEAITEGSASKHEIRVRSSLAPDGRVLVEIGDTGKGMSPDVLSKIFDPFFTTKDISLGTGLGLSIARRILSGIGGEITVDSHPGNGTTFRVLLPKSNRPAALHGAILAKAKEGGKLSRRRLLVVDDEKDIGTLIQAILHDEHEVVAVESGREALRLVTEGQGFDAILCDLIMPEMSGMEFFDKVQQMGHGLEKRIIFITGGTFTSRSREFLRTVPNFFMEKPLEFTQLRKLLASVAPTSSIPLKAAA